MKLSQQLMQDHLSGDFGLALEGYSERARELEVALERIEKWAGEFPPSGRFYDEAETQPVTYGAAFGSNGERDYMRNLAKSALVWTDT